MTGEGREIDDTVPLLAYSGSCSQIQRASISVIVNCDRESLEGAEVVCGPIGTEGVTEVGPAAVCYRYKLKR